MHGIPAATLIKKLRDEINKVDKGSFYDKTETDALLNALQEHVDSKISSATSIAASGDGYIRLQMAHRFAGSNSMAGLERATITIFRFLCHLLTQIMVPVLLLAQA